MVGVQSDSLHDVILARENEWMGAWLRRGRAKAHWNRRRFTWTVCFSRRVMRLLLATIALTFVNRAQA